MPSILRTLTLIITFTLSTSAFAQNANIKKLSDSVYSIFLHHYQSLVVIGNDGVLITDPANPVRANALKKEISKLTSLPVNKIVLTHEHYDHAGGTNVFPSAEIYAHRATASVFRLDVTGSAPKKVDHYVGDKTVLNVGTTTVELLHFGAADGVGMLAIYLPNEKVVLSADLYENGSITEGKYLADTNFLGSRALLNALSSFEPNYAITTHSIETDPAFLSEAVNFYNDLYAAVEPQIRQAMPNGFGAIIQTTDSLKESVELPKYKHLGNYDHLPAHVERMAFSIFHGG